MKKNVNIKELATGRKNMHILPIDKIFVDPSWNERTMDSEKTRQHIEELALSISRVGVRQPLTVVGRGDKVHLTDGYCRMAAVKLAIKKYGVDLKGVPVIIEEKGTGDADHVATMLISNSGLPLSFDEQARVVKRLLAFGWSKQDISEKTGRSLTHIDNCIMILEADPVIMEALKAGKISGRFAVDAIRNKGSKAAEYVQKEIESAAAQGKVKATKRTAKKNKPGLSWAIHGPEFFSILERLETAFDELQEDLPASVADAIVYYKDYKAEKNIKSQAE